MDLIPRSLHFKLPCITAINVQQNRIFHCILFLIVVFHSAQFHSTSHLERTHVQQTFIRRTQFLKLENSKDILGLGLVKGLSTRCQLQFGRSGEWLLGIGQGYYLIKGGRYTVWLSHSATYLITTRIVCVGRSKR